MWWAIGLVAAFLAGPVCLVFLGYCITRKLVTGRWRR